MIESMPAAMAAWNGGASICRHWPRSGSTTGRLVWLSSAVSPWPGKCLAVDDHRVRARTIWPPR